MEQVKVIGAKILPLATHVTKNVGDVVETDVHWSWAVPTGTHRFYLWSIFGKKDYPNPGDFSFMSGAFGFMAMDATGTADDWSSISITLGEYGEVANGDWDCLLLICETSDFFTGFIYDGATILNALTITGGALEAYLIEVGFH